MLVDEALHRLLNLHDAQLVQVHLPTGSVPTKVEHMRLRLSHAMPDDSGPPPPPASTRVRSQRKPPGGGAQEAGFKVMGGGGEGGDGGGFALSCSRPMVESRRRSVSVCSVSSLRVRSW
jgi:hypothetical protein